MERRTFIFVSLDQNKRVLLITVVYVAILLKMALLITLAVVYAIAIKLKIMVLLITLAVVYLYAIAINFSSRKAARWLVNVIAINNVVDIVNNVKTKSIMINIIKNIIMMFNIFINSIFVVNIYITDNILVDIFVGLILFGGWEDKVLIFSIQNLYFSEYNEDFSTFTEDHFSHPEHVCLLDFLPIHPRANGFFANPSLFKSKIHAGVSVSQSRKQMLKIDKENELERCNI